MDGLVQGVDRFVFVIADVPDNFVILHGTKNNSCSGRMRSRPPVGGTRAGVDQVARVLHIFGNCWNELLNSSIT